MVVEAITNHEIVLLDVRSEKEYKGSRNVKRSGHIPGARWWSWDQAVDFNGGFVAADPKQLLESLGAVGAKPETTVIAYCRSGHRASQTYFTLRWLGFEDVRVYDGSTAEWSARNDLPIRTGRQP